MRISFNTNNNFAYNKRPRPKSRAFCFLCAAAFAILTSACSQKELHRVNGQAFGTTYSVSYFGKNDNSIKQNIDSILADLSATFSIFDTCSMIFRINKGEDVEVNDDFVRVFNMSRSVNELTFGAFNVAIQPLVELWGFGKGSSRHVVGEDSIANVLKHIDVSKVRCVDNRIVKEDSLLQLNFNAVAKGYAVDKIADYLMYAGYSDCLVEIGGEVAVRGSKNGKPWKVGIQVPCQNAADATESFESINLQNGQAVATSGNYRNYFEENGVRYTHILDPRTGYPERTSLLSVTVLAKDCATADAFATAFMVLGFNQASKIVKQNPNIEAWFILSNDDNGWELKHVK